MSLEISEITVMHNGAVLHLASSQARRISGVDAYEFSIAFSNVWKVHRADVRVTVPSDVDVIFQFIDQQAVLATLPIRVKRVLKSMLVYQAALRNWPNAKHAAVDPGCAHQTLVAMVAEPDSLDRIVAELGKLLLVCRDLEARVNSVGAALSLGVSMQAIRRAARLLFRDGYISAGAAVYDDDKHESFDPCAAIVLNEAKLDRFAAWLQTRRELANLPIRFDFSRLHPEIAAEAGPSFEAGRWAAAQLNALRAATLMARKKAGIANDDDEGEATMRGLFAQDRSKNRGPWLRVDSSADWDATQAGMQRLFEGAQKLSNQVRHHEPHHGADADSAFEYIVLASLLARVVDRSTVVSKKDATGG